MHTPLPGIKDGGMAHGSDLDRFVAAQAPMFEQVACELRAGEKRSHWMRFVFTQLVGVGSSPTARRYVIVSFGEARAYFRRPVLGPRLIECTGWPKRCRAAARRARSSAAPKAPDAAPR